MKLPKRPPLLFHQARTPHVNCFHRIYCRPTWLEFVWFLDLWVLWLNSKCHAILLSSVLSTPNKPEWMHDLLLSTIVALLEIDVIQLCPLFEVCKYFYYSWSPTHTHNRKIQTKRKVSEMRNDCDEIQSKIIFQFKLFTVIWFRCVSVPTPTPTFSWRRIQLQCWPDNMSKILSNSSLGNFI